MLTNSYGMEKLFNKNLSFLSDNLRKRLLNINKKELWENIEIIESEEKTPICKYIDDGRIFRLNSTRPLKEVENWCNNLPIDDAGTLFLYGCGFGYPILELLRQKQPNTLVMVFEQNIYIFAAMLYYFDLEPVFKTQKFTFFVGDIKDFSNEFQQVFGSEVFLYSTAPFAVFTPIAQRNFHDRYLRIHQHIFKELSLNIFYMGNDHYDTLLGFHNLISNVNQVIKNPYFSILKNKYKSFPAFIIANGPSLDKSLSALRKINRKGLIISTESAIVPLIKNNIIPDILCIVERTHDSYVYHFENRNYPDKISLIGLALIDKNIFPSFSGSKIPLFRSTESINVWMNKIIGDEDSKINAGANVSHLTFEIAAFLGANPIILVGQNFAFGPSGITHSKDAVYLTDKGKKALNTIKSKPVVYVENNYGKQIPSTQLWTDFKHGLERKISTHIENLVINTTLDGAKIEGASLEELDTVIDKYCLRKIPYQVNELIIEGKKEINIAERNQKLRKLISELAKYATKYRELCHLAVKGLVRSREMHNLASQNSLTDNEINILEKAYEDNFNDIRQFMNDNIYLVFLQQVLIVGHHKINRLGLINSQERIKRIFQIYEEIFNSLNTVSQSVAVNFEMAIEKLERSR